MRNLHDDVIKWKHYPCYWPFVRGIHQSQGPVMRSFDVFFDLRLNKRLGTQSWGQRFETPSYSLWRHCNNLGHFFRPHSTIVLYISMLLWIESCFTDVMICHYFFPVSELINRVLNAVFTTYRHNIFRSQSLTYRTLQSLLRLQLWWLNWQNICAVKTLA